MAWDVFFRAAIMAWDVLSGVANRCGMFCLGCQKIALDVLSRDVLSYIQIYWFQLQLVITFKVSNSLDPDKALTECRA